VKNPVILEGSWRKRQRKRGAVFADRMPRRERERARERRELAMASSEMQRKREGESNPTSRSVPLIC
jgi:hypothetical protein